MYTFLTEEVAHSIIIDLYFWGGFPVEFRQSLAKKCYDTQKWAEMCVNMRSMVCARHMISIEPCTQCHVFPLSHLRFSHVS